MYLSAKEIAEKFGMEVKTVRNLCHARNQKFAYRLAPNGKFYIDPDKFKEFVERKLA
jgi:hypothetical protein